MMADDQVAAVDVPVPAAQTIDIAGMVDGMSVSPLEAMYLQDTHHDLPDINNSQAERVHELQPSTTLPSQGLNATHPHSVRRETPPARPLQQPPEGMQHDTAPSSPILNSATAKPLWVHRHSIEPATTTPSSSSTHLPIAIAAHGSQPTTKSAELTTSTALASPTKPTAPARPARPRPPSVASVVAAAMRNPELVTADEMIEPTAAVIVTFDVGGTIFRCKQRVVEKYPNKRLHRLLLCGCEQQSSASIISTSTQTTAASLATCAPTTTAIFVDRNPTYFAPILDWYRCGTFHVPDSLSVAGLQHEAAYFDVLADMFPTLDTANTTLPPAPIQSSLASATATPLSPHSTLQSAQTPTIIPTLATAIHCFVKSYTHTLVPSQPPIVFVLRAHEQLVLDSAAGVGRLLLRVTDLHGNTTVSRAVLYDSHSYFFLGGGLAKLHGTPFPGNLIYSFWADDTCTTTTTTSTLASSGGGVEMLPPLHVEFKLRCAFHKSDELVLAAHEQQLLGHTLDMVAKTTSATITTAVLAGLDLSLHVTASVAGRKERENTRPAVVPAQQPPVHLLAATPAVRLAIPTVSTTNDRNSSVAPAQGYRPPPPVAAATAVPPAVASQAYNTSKEHAISLPEKTKERAQILDEAQQFQSKVKEHAAWLQHYQREVQQSTAILREPPSNSDSNSPNKKGSTGAAATNVTPRQVGKRK